MFFYLNWKDKRPSDIKLLNERPEKINFENDFHCNKYIIEYVYNKHSQYKKEYIKKLIWEFSSSINKRITIIKDKSLEKDWDVISNTLRIFQKNCNFY